MVEAKFFSWNPRIPCLHLLPSSSLMLRQLEKLFSDASSVGASHQAKQPSAMLIGLGLQQATNAWLLVLVDGTNAKVMLDVMSTFEASGTPSGQLEAFHDMVSLRVGPGMAVEEN